MRMEFERIKGIIPTVPPYPPLYHDIAKLLEGFTCEPEAIVRTLAWLIGGIIGATDFCDKKRQRLIDLVVYDIMSIAASAVEKK